MNSKKMIMTALAGLLALFGAVRIHAQSGGFRLFGPLSRVVTPNGDGLNDRLFICYDNFSDSGVSGRIYTLLGAEVASMTHERTALAGCAGGTLPQHASWNGRTSEGPVRGGLYVYRIESEGKTYAGTFLVVR
ncbi:MAG: gliding motility-associated C-terminal domain-containing protein [Elusimicrobia bacterium]|nr:gliding motility-associated C-terminal domain-containing protein [Elusimicrobiota bacterium]